MSTEVGLSQSAGEAIPLTAIPLVSKFELLERLLKEAYGDQKSRFTIQIKGHQSTTEACVDSGSDLSFISTSLYNDLKASDHAILGPTTAGPPERPRIFLTWSNGDNLPYAKSYFGVSPSNLPADVLLGRDSITLGRLLDPLIFRSCFQRLRLWAVDISDQDESPSTSVGHVLQVLEDADIELAQSVHEAFSRMIQDVKAIRPKKNSEIPISWPTEDEGDQVTRSLLARLSELSGLVRQIREEIAIALKQKKPPRGNAILSLDGGGIRSYSSIFILRALMTEIEKVSWEMESNHGIVNKSEDLLPRDFFDYIFGASSGGLLSIMLGRLRMSGHESGKAFHNYASKIFDHPRFFSYRGIIFIPRSTYSSKIVDAAIKECVEEEEPDSTRPWKRNVFATPGDPCKTGVFTLRSDEKSDEMCLLRTYNSSDQLLNTSAQVARAGIAAPTFFDPVTTEGSTFRDGGFGMNNPAFAALREVLRNTKISSNIKNTSEKQKPVVSTLVSIGTGKRKKRSSYRIASYSLLRETLGSVYYAQKLASDSENVHQELLSTLPLIDEGRIQYFRFNVDVGLENIALDTWLGSPPRGYSSKTASILAAIQKATDDYLKSEEVKDSLRKCARALVMARRYRTPPKIDPLPAYESPSSGPSDPAKTKPVHKTDGKGKQEVLAQVS